MVTPTPSSQVPQSNPGETPSKKGLPTWVKVLIVLAILGIGFLALLGVGIKMMGSYLQHGGAEKLIEKGIQKGLEIGIEKALQQAGEKEGVNIPDIDFKLEEKGIVVKDEKSGEQFAVKADGEMPQEFPKEIPIYPGTKVVASMILGPMKMVTLETTEDSKNVQTFYANRMSEKGWSSPFSGQMENNQHTSMFQKDSQQLTVNISTEGGKTIIALSHTLME